MSDQPFSRRRTTTALIVAPLAAPIAAFVGTVLYGATVHRPGPQDPPTTLGAVLVVMLAFIVFGAPVAYVATAAVVWPASLLLRSAGLVRSWSLTTIAALAGALLLPVYAHWLAPRGTIDFFPGMGLVSGTAVGWTWWFIAARDVS
jgi:hypothetical protein